MSNRILIKIIEKSIRKNGNEMMTLKHLLALLKMEDKIRQQKEEEDEDGDIINENQFEIY